MVSNHSYPRKVGRRYQEPKVYNCDNSNEYSIPTYRSQTWFFPLKRDFVGSTRHDMNTNKLADTRHAGFETGDGLTVEDKLGSLVSLGIASALKVSLDEAFV